MNVNHLRNPAAPITPAQVTAIKMGVNFLGISDEVYRDTLWVRYGATSCKDLNQEQASDLIEDYVSRGFVLIQPEWKGKGKKRNQNFVPPKRKPAPERKPIPRDGNVIALATAGEIEKINAVAALIAWRETNGLELFLLKRMRLKNGKVRTSEDAYLAIEGLKKMFENGMKKAHGENWWNMDFGRRDIHEYIFMHRPRR
jgi:Protein of unknown function (DUF1018)